MAQKIKIITFVFFACFLSPSESHQPSSSEKNCITKNYYSNDNKNGEIFFFHIKERAVFVVNADYAFPLEKNEPHGIQCASFAEMTICDPNRKNFLFPDFSINFVGTDVVATISGEPIDTTVHDTTYSGRTTRVFYSTNGHIIAFSPLMKDHFIIYVTCDEEGAISFHDLYD